MTYIVGDCGSCWNGKTSYGKELIRVGRECGLSAIKFQLFRGKEYTDRGNLELPFEVYDEFYNYGKSIGAEVTASVFDRECLERVIRNPIPFVKFGYSVRKTLQDNIWAIIRLGKKVFVSTNPMESHILPNDPGFKKFFVHTDREGGIYPVVEQLNFERMFPEMFQGLSDHALGVENAIRAKAAGCTHFECHITLPYSDIQVPDRWFAKEPKDLEKYVRALT